MNTGVYKGEHKSQRSEVMSLTSPGCISTYCVEPSVSHLHPTSRTRAWCQAGTEFKQAVWPFIYE